MGLGISAALSVLLTQPGAIWGEALNKGLSIRLACGESLARVASDGLRWVRRPTVVVSMRGPPYSQTFRCALPGRVMDVPLLEEV